MAARRPLLLATALAALVLPAAARAGAGEEGFGGQPASPGAERESACTVKTDDGRWVTCAQHLVELEAARVRDQAAAAAKAPPREKTEKQARPKDPPPMHTGGRTSPVKPVHLDRSRGPQAFLDRATADATTTPLGDLRDEVLALFRAQKTLVEDKEADPDQRKAAIATYRARRAVLSDVEGAALRLRDVCAAYTLDEDAYEEWMPALRGRRLGLDDPIAAGMMRTADPAGCDREELVTEEHIARIERLHEVERALATGRFSYFDAKKKRALEEERDALVGWLKGTGGPAGATVKKLQPLSPMTKRTIQ